MTYHDRIELWETKEYDSPNDKLYADNNSIKNMITYNENEYPWTNFPFYRLSSPKYKISCGRGGTRLHLPYINLSTGEVIDKSYTTNDRDESPTKILGIRLNTITYRGGSIVFHENINEIIDSIRVTDGQKQRSIYFHQSFTGTKLSSDMNFAKKCNVGYDDNIPYQGTNYLDSVIIGDDRYAFRYYEKYCFGSHLIGSDFWGYVNEYTDVARYNSNESNDIRESRLTIPRITKLISRPFDWYTTTSRTVSFGGQNITREQPSETDMRKGVLSHIIYPAGGITNFVFEANKYKDLFTYYFRDENDNTIEIIADNVKTLRNGGGLRIRSIAHYTGDGQTAASLKYYKYGELEEGDGEVANKPAIKQNNTEWPPYCEYSGFSYSQEIRYATYDTWNIYPEGVGEKTDTKTTYLPFSALDNTYANGSPVYYTKVTEYRTKTGEDAGKTVYDYYNRYELINNTAIEPADPQSSMIEGTNITRLKVDWYLGALKSVTDYKYTGEKYKPVHIKTMKYTAWQPTMVSPRVIWAFPLEIYGLVGAANNTQSYQGNVWNKVCNYDYGVYTLTPGKLLLKQEKEEWIDNNDKRTSILTTYEYNNLSNLKIQPSRINRQSSDGTVSALLKYSYDFLNDGALSQLYSKNIISPVIEETVIDSVSNTEISRAKVNYTVQNDRVLRSNIMSSSQVAPLTADITFNQYDEYDNPIQATYRDGQVKTWVWGYNRKYMVAEVTGKTFAEVSAALNMNTINNPSSEDALKTQLNNLYNLSGSNVMVNAYTYIPLSGVSWHSSPGKVTTKYEYDIYGRLKKIRGHNGEILNEYVYYNRKTPNMPLNDILPFTTLPAMETYSGMVFMDANRTCNYFRPGGEMYEYDKGDTFSVADYNTGIDYAYSNYVNRDIGPNYIWLHFMKSSEDSNSDNAVLSSNIQFYIYDSDNTLVACVHMESRHKDDRNDGYRDLFLPAGEYTVKWVMQGLDYNKTPMRFSIRSTDTDEGWSINSGDTIDLTGTGYNYVIMIME